LFDNKLPILVKERSVQAPRKEKKRSCIPDENVQLTTGKMSDLNNKIETIIAGLGGLSLDDDDRGIVTQQLRGLKNRGLGVKLKPLEHYNGKSRPLRSWLTEASLHMESNGIADDKSKIVFIGSHLKDNAWSWFEPFMRERDTKQETEWSDRTTKVLKNYAELTKAMGQVFGDIDERKTAATKLQKLRQVSSVRQYITEFQTITSNLEWDEEALSDKFEEGLKPEVRSALIYYPREPKDLEELFERAQKVDREMWNRNSYQDRRLTKPYSSYDQSTTRYYNKHSNRNRIDREGDTIMTGAKVSMVDANKKKAGKCFNCGIEGHYARNCQRRKKTPEQPRTTLSNGNIIRMVRVEELTSNVTNLTARESGTQSEEESEDEGSDQEEIEKEQLDVSTLFQGLTEQDFSSEESSSESPTEAINWEELQSQMENNGSSLESIYHMQDWIRERRQRPSDHGQDDHQEDQNENDIDINDNSDELSDAQNEMRSPGDTTGIEINSASRGSDSPMEGHRPRGIQGSSSSSQEKLTLIDTFPVLSRKFTELAGRLNAVNFLKLTHGNTIWKDFCEQRTTDTVEKYQRWYNRMNATNRHCKCYGFDPTRWAKTGNKWMRHIIECRHCRSWSNIQCPVSGHSVASKRTTLIDISERRFTPWNTNKDRKAICCIKELCTHEFWTHGKIDVPWWACYNETCAEHYAMKVKNGIRPTIPIVTILNNDTCPCLRKGCICGFDKRHLLHRELVTMRQCLDDKCTDHEPETTDVYELDQEVAIFREEIRNATKEIKDLMGTLIRVRKTTTEGPTRQMETTIRVNNKTETAIIDSGADINYVNKEWCTQNGIEYQITGYGKIKAYDGSIVQELIRKATIEFELQGHQGRQIFHVFTETGKDKIVLGMPWLEDENPEIDWKTKEMTIRKESPKTLSISKGNVEKTFAHRSTKSKIRSQTNGITPTLIGDPVSAGRGGYNSDSRRIGRATLEDRTLSDPDKQKSEYEQELQEVLTKLPKELQEYVSVFCKEK
jgi:Retrotransposon gag protein/Zinc knuckle